MRVFLLKLSDFRKDQSLAIKLRLRTITLFKELLFTLPKPLNILDVGGTEIFWERLGFANENNFKITLLNLMKVETHYQNITSIAGDARNLKSFQDDEFDIVFSHSTIEHVGDFEDQKQMALEIQRVGKRFFLQTPNYYFPIEPHFLFPLFQFFPLWLKIFLIRHFKLGWFDKTPDEEEAIKIINSIRLLKKQELSELFPGAEIYHEKIIGITIFFIVSKGWK